MQRAAVYQERCGFLFLFLLYDTAHDVHTAPRTARRHLVFLAHAPLCTCFVAMCCTHVRVVAGATVSALFHFRAVCAAGVSCVLGLYFVGLLWLFLCWLTLAQWWCNKVELSAAPRVLAG